MAKPKKLSSRRQDTYLGKVIAGRYRLEEQLGEGGMGVVYRARHILIDRVVAVKLIRPDLRSETHLRAWMLREARAANRVDHAHIVDIHDVGETDDNELYLVMEYLVGDSLASQINKGPMPITRAVDILEQMCAALARAHDLGVVHRDLKSDNIMLVVRGGRHDYVKILDFGLAALARDPRLAPKGSVFGTPEYMSPEQARGEDATASSDLYALGILFFEMLVGYLPFRAKTRDALLEMQRTALPPAVRSLRKDAPQSAETIILKLLEKDPAKRFRDGHHLQEELKAFQRSLPSMPWDVKLSDVPASPPPPPPARSPGVVEWSQRAANFSRLVARVYSNSSAPAEIQSAADRMWDLAAKASRLEGELSSQSRKLQTIERRGRALRAEIGRKAEELAQEESRAMREAGTERQRGQKIGEHLQQAKQDYEEMHQRVNALQAEASSELSPQMFERLGELRGLTQVYQRVIADHEGRAQKREAYAAGLRKQIQDLRAQLRRYSDILENDLSAGRDRIAERTREALDYEKSFIDASTILVRHFRNYPECRQLLEEIGREDELMREAHESRDTIEKAS